MKRPQKPKPGPTQILRPEKVEDADQILPPQVEANYGLWPEIVRDPNILVQTKADANEKRRLAAQLPNKVLAAIYGYLDRHPDASNNAIANWLKRIPRSRRSSRTSSPNRWLTRSARSRNKPAMA